MGILDLVKQYGKRNLLVQLRIDTENYYNKNVKLDHGVIAFYTIDESRYKLHKDYKIGFECISTDEQYSEQYYISDFDSLLATIKEFNVYRTTPQFISAIRKTTFSANTRCLFNNQLIEVKPGFFLPHKLFVSVQDERHNPIVEDIYLCKTREHPNPMEQQLIALNKIYNIFSQGLGRKPTPLISLKDI